MVQVIGKSYPRVEKGEKTQYRIECTPEDYDKFMLVNMSKERGCYIVSELNLLTIMAFCYQSGREDAMKTAKERFDNVFSL